MSAHCTDTPDCGKHIFDGGLGEKSPKLIISREAEDDSTEQRLKRWADTHDDESSGSNDTLDGSNETVNEKYYQLNETTCCLHPLHINFKEDLGLDYIIEPKSFEANYCLGNCKDDISLPAVFEFYKRLPSDHPASSIRPRVFHVA